MMRNLPRVKSMSFLSYCMSTNWRTTRRLVIVIVADEVFHRIIGEEVLELGGELGRQRLVVAHHQGGTLHPLYDVGHGEGLAAAGNAQQCLGSVAPAQAFHQFIHRLGLVTGHLEIGDYLELWHIQHSISSHRNTGKRGGIGKVPT